MSASGSTATATASATPTATATATSVASATATATSAPTATPTSPPSATSTTRVITYAYDGLQRLIGADESSGTSYSYAYDDAGNRIGVWVNSTRTVTQTFNAANQVNGLTYDDAGNLTNDGTTTFTYDPLNRMTGSGGTTYSYNGDGVLVDDGTTRYTQDLASPLSQVVQTTQGATTTNYLYGLDRLAAVVGSTRTWYGADALGSVRQTLNDTGAPLGVINYDPWGTVESGIVPTFGFTGEVQSGGLVNLRARWYATGQGTLTSRDPFAGMPETPYSQQPYQYGYANPVGNTDPTGNRAETTPPIQPICPLFYGWDTQRKVCVRESWAPSFLPDTAERTIPLLPGPGVVASGTAGQLGEQVTGQAAKEALEKVVQTCGIFFIYLLGQEAQTNTQTQTRTRSRPSGSYVADANIFLDNASGDPFLREYIDSEIFTNPNIPLYLAPAAVEEVFEGRVSITELEQLYGFPGARELYQYPKLT